MLRKLWNTGIEIGPVVAASFGITVTAGAGFPEGLHALQQDLAKTRGGSPAT